MKTRSLIVDVDDIAITTAREGFELKFIEYADGGVKRRAVLKFKDGWWIQHIAAKLWQYVNDRQKELDSSKNALKGDS